MKSSACGQSLFISEVQGQGNYAVLWTKAASRKIQCSVCESVLRNQRALYNHVYQQHLKKHIYVCQIYSRGFLSKDPYEQTKAKDPRLLQCGVSYFYKSNLKKRAEVKDCHICEICNNELAFCFMEVKCVRFSTIRFAL